MSSEINPSALYWASFNRFELRLPGEAVLDIAQSGPNDEAVTYWAPRIYEQVEKDGFQNCPTPDKVRAELKEYGAWDADELSDDAANWQRLVWCTAWSISEAPDCTEPVVKGGKQ